MSTNLNINYTIVASDTNTTTYSLMGHYVTISDALRVLSMTIKLFPYVRLLDANTGEILAEFEQSELVYTVGESRK